MEAKRRCILVVYHSQGGTMQRMTDLFAEGAAKEKSVKSVLKRASDSDIDDRLNYDAIAISSPKYFGTMAGMIKDFFNRIYEAGREKTHGLPFVIFVCAGNDGQGAIMQIERIAAGYGSKKVQEHFRVAGSPTEKDLAGVEELEIKQEADKK